MIKMPVYKPAFLLGEGGRSTPARKRVAGKRRFSFSRPIKVRLRAIKS
jgi:hypothetical protein